MNEDKNEEFSISTPAFSMSARGTLLVFILAVVASSSVNWYILTEQNRAIEVMFENQRRIISGIHEISCLLGVEVGDRRRAIAEDWCVDYMDRRVKKNDPNRLGAPSGAGFGG